RSRWSNPHRKHPPRRHGDNHPTKPKPGFAWTPVRRKQKQLALRSQPTAFRPGSIDRDRSETVVHTCTELKVAGDAAGGGDAWRRIGPGHVKFNWRLRDHCVAHVPANQPMNGRIVFRDATQVERALCYASKVSRGQARIHVNRRILKRVGRAEKSWPNLAEETKASMPYSSLRSDQQIHGL